VCTAKYSPRRFHRWRCPSLSHLSCGADGNPAAWPSERSRRVGPEVLNHRLACYRDALGMDGWDPRFVQEQVGHDHASTTSIYTCVSSDYRTRTLRRALDGMVAAGTSATARRLIDHRGPRWRRSPATTPAAMAVPRSSRLIT
jgi:integrase